MNTIRLDECQKGADAVRSEIKTDGHDLVAAIDGFKLDPPDNNFQRGYLFVLLRASRGQA